MRGEVKRITYAPTRAMTWQESGSCSPPANYWSLDHDERTRAAKGFTLHATEREYARVTVSSSSATDFYDIDKGPKMSLQRSVSRSSRRYTGMQTLSAGRSGPLSAALATGHAVGPGSYSPGARRVAAPPPRRPVGSAPFASAVERSWESRQPHPAAEPGYATVALDARCWLQHSNHLPRGRSFGNAQRFRRAPGPGSNVPTPSTTPGPGAYGKSRPICPPAGFSGTSRGHHHLGR